MTARDVIQKIHGELLIEMERLAGGRPTLPVKTGLFKADAVALASEVVVC